MFRVSAVSDLAEALLPDLSFAGLSKKSKQADSEDERGEWSRVIVGHVQRMTGPGRGGDPSERAPDKYVKGVMFGSLDSSCGRCGKPGSKSSLGHHGGSTACLARAAAWRCAHTQRLQ